MPRRAAPAEVTKGSARGRDGACVRDGRHSPQVLYRCDRTRASRDAGPAHHPPRRWLPKRVLVTRSAYERDHGRAIVERCEAAGVADIQLLRSDRLPPLTSCSTPSPPPRPTYQVWTSRPSSSRTRFTAKSKDVLLGWYPRTALEMDEDLRRAASPDLVRRSSGIPATASCGRHSRGRRSGRSWNGSSRASGRRPGLAGVAETAQGAARASGPTSGRRSGSRTAVRGASRCPGGLRARRPRILLVSPHGTRFADRPSPFVDLHPARGVEVVAPSRGRYSAPRR